MIQRIIDFLIVTIPIDMALSIAAEATDSVSLAITEEWLQRGLIVGLLVIVGFFLRRELTRKDGEYDKLIQERREDNAEIRNNFNKAINDLSASTNAVLIIVKQQDIRIQDLKERQDKSDEKFKEYDDMIRKFLSQAK